MSSCGPKCGGGCCSDFSSRAPQKPSLLQIDVVLPIFQQAIRNMGIRCAQLHSGMMSEDEYQEKKEVLVDWLFKTFTGCNPHFHSDPDWHENYGLGEMLSLRSDRSLSYRDHIMQGCQDFADDADDCVHKLMAHGGMDSDAAHVAIDQVASLWAHLFVGAPEPWEYQQ